MEVTSRSITGMIKYVTSDTFEIEWCKREREIEV